MSDGSPIEIVLGKLEGTRTSGDSGRQWTAACPAHADAHNSLGVGVKKDGVVVLKCYAGCEQKAVIAALGIEAKELFPGKQKRVRPEGVTVVALGFDKRLPVDFLKGECFLEDDVTDTGNRRVFIPYKDEAGVELFKRTRKALKAKEGSLQPRGVSLQAYGRWRLPSYRAAGNVLILVEGESDAWTLWFHGYPCLGIPGAQAVKSLSASDLEGFDSVYVWRDGKTKVEDASGEKFVQSAAARVKEMRPSATVKVICSPEVKDPNELNQRYQEEFKFRFDAILAVASEPPEPKPEDATPAAFAPTDLGNAQRLVFRHGKDLRYAEGIGQWYVWDGRRWRARGVGSVIARAKETVRSIVTEIPKDADQATRQKMHSHAMHSESARAIRDMVKLAESESLIIVEPGDLNSNQFAYNPTNGTIDMSTATARPHRREDLITKMSPVEYHPDAKCPIWESFLSRVFAKNPEDPADTGDADLIAFIQRLLGYCITGSVEEQVLPIFWGSGSNGKSTLLNVVREVMGKDYAVKAPRGLLMQKHTESHPTELTVLFGARLVIATETRRGQRLSEELVKDLTGGESITARHMRQDFFEFEPTHKIILCTNHRPRIPESDDGIWRRVILVPFKTRFWNPTKGEVGPDHLQRDNSLIKKLRDEFPGILAWMVRGCMEWQRIGLMAPASVQEETESYRSEEDRTGQYLEDRCVISNGGKDTTLKAVYADYCKWCEEGGYRHLARNDFSADLRSHGVKIDNGAHNKVMCFGLEFVVIKPTVEGESVLQQLDDQ